MKNDFLKEKENIFFRRAKLDDNFEQIAELIYDTDPFIYPFWFGNNKSEAIRVLSNKIDDKGFVFHYDNLYVAYDMETNAIVGFICALDKSINFNYDYSELEKINSNYDFTIKNYIKPIIKDVVEYDDNSIYIINVCVKQNLRGKHIGTRLLGYFLSQMEEQGYDKFYLDCLLHNLRARNLYHSFSFREMKEVVGFDGTDSSKVEVVAMLRKKGAYLPKDFL